MFTVSHDSLQLFTASVVRRFLPFSSMANKADKEEIIRQGKELWKALKSDPVDKKRMLELLESGAPANFREPGSGKVRLYMNCSLDLCLHSLQFGYDIGK